ncbi:hypothetical protein CEXT_343611 [Caerostris extrusa]|uniref:Uncharacterized protein n=1 Tax=Caerostris extrusa TaxID=172846 RepID=A0AAV4XMS8_CAEEX|nr:hypothetical protein CEXT_343611 [Caerostris extrusa]
MDWFKSGPLPKLYNFLSETIQTCDMNTRALITRHSEGTIAIKQHLCYKFLEKEAFSIRLNVLPSGETWEEDDEKKVFGRLWDVWMKKEGRHEEGDIDK